MGLIYIVSFLYWVSVAVKISKFSVLKRARAEDQPRIVLSVVPSRIF